MLTNDQLWARVQTLDGQTIYTIDQRRPNRISSTANNQVEIDNRNTRPTRDQIFEAYELLHRDGSICLCNMPDWFSNNRVGRIIMAILGQAVPEEIETFNRLNSPLLCHHSGIRLIQH